MQMSSSAKLRSKNLQSNVLTSKSSKIEKINPENNRLCSTWALKFVFSTEEVRCPLGVLFEDFGCTISNHIDLSCWCVGSDVFNKIGKSCSKIGSITMDYCVGFDLAYLKNIRGFKNLSKLSIRGIVNISDDVAKLFGSLPLLYELDISENNLSEQACSIMSQSCKKLHSIKIRNCADLNDACLQAFAQCMQRYRKLGMYDLSGSTSFSDEGILSILTAAPNILSSLTLENCTQLSSLSMAGLRQKMPILRTLILANTNISQSGFEWIPEGCFALEKIDFSNCINIDNKALTLIGRKCHKLRVINLKDCIEIGDEGIEGFFEHFEGHIVDFNISGCIYCGAKSVIIIAEHCSQLKVLAMAGLAKITGLSLKKILSCAAALEVLDMSMELKVAVTHRQSVLPHVTDESLSKCAGKLIELNISGAALLTDRGILSLCKRCKNLLYLDISYCNQLTDEAVKHICSYIQNIRKLDVSGDIKLTNRSLQLLSSSCLQLASLQFNGCPKISDLGLSSLSTLVKLTSLSCRGCDLVTDTSLSSLAPHLVNLRFLDISSLDMVTSECIKDFVRYCPYLSHINCEGCAMTSVNFHNAVEDQLPLSRSQAGHCKLVMREKPVVQYNRYVLEMRQKDKAARVLQKLCKVICCTAWLKLASLIRHRAIRIIVRAFRVYMKNIGKIRKRQLKEKRYLAARVIQQYFRRLNGVFHAKNKLKHMKSKSAAATIIQRIFRGCKSRKKYRRRFLRIYSYYAKIGFLAHKYWVIVPARRLRRQIVLVQSIVRMFIKYRQFRRAKRGISLLQHHSRKRLARQVVIHRLLIDMITLIDRKDWAVKLLQKNFRAILFNKMMSPFILICCIYHRTEWDSHMWNANVIQRYWRGAIVRLKIAREKARPFIEFHSACKIQCLWRKYAARQRVKRIRWKKRKNLNRWRKMVIARPALRLGIFCRIIQKKYRHYYVQSRVNHYATQIQRTARGWMGRKYASEVKEKRDFLCCCRIQRMIRRFLGRRRRRQRIAREHMAAWKIQRAFRLSYDVAALRRINAAVNARKRREQVEEKKKLLIAKRTKALHKLRDSLQNMYAARIQRVYRKWYKEKMKLINAIKNRKAAMQDAKDEYFELQTRRLFNKLSFNPVKMVRDFAWYVHNNLNSHGLTMMKGDEERLQHGILTNQTQSLLQEGAVEIHLTLGEIELKTFQQGQDIARHSHLPYYVRLPQDLSGSMNLDLYLWVVYGTGRECICSLSVEMKPTGMSYAAAKLREDNMRGLGYKIAWHPDCHIEIQGYCPIKLGKVGYGIQEIRVSLDPKEHDFLREKDFKLVKNLQKMGFSSSIWAISRSPQENPDIFKIGTLSVRPWADKRLIRLVKGFNMNEAEVLRIHDTFEQILNFRLVEFLDYRDILVFLDITDCQMIRWIFDAVEPIRKNCMNFSEYFHLVCYFCMFGRKDMLRFLFGCMDEEKNNYMDKDKFFKFLDVLSEGNESFVLLWQRQFLNFADPKLKLLFVDGFDQFCASNPQALWRAQHLQKLIRRHNLGESFWEKKMNQFRVTRETLGIKLMS